MERVGSPKTEWAWGLLLLALGVGARVAFASVFPTVPLSDFRGIVDFALDLRDKSLFAPGYYWDVFNLGPPLVLSLVLRVFPGDPEATARYATAVWCGLMPLLPFLFWRRVLPLWVRVTGGLLLALWPGQVFFSGVVAQENWMIVPAVGLACLAVRPLLGASRGHPVAAGLLYALAVSMRQEMLVVLAPPLLAAAGFTRREGWRPRQVLACGLAVGLPFLALALQRQKVTGDFALSSVHGGFTLLGTVIPGATAVYWEDPVSYIASVEPGLVRDRKRMFSEAKRLAWAEVKRRPGFQVLRATSMALRFPFRSDAELLYWSVEAPEALPEALRSRAEVFSRRVFYPLVAEMAGIQALFLASLGLGLWRRNGAILVISLAALLKIGLHAVLVSAARFYMPATALELVVISLGLWEASRSKDPRTPWKALAWGFAASVSLLFLSRPLFAHVRKLDSVPEQRTYRFLLTSWEHPGELRCVVRQGRLTALGETEAVLETLNVHPRPGEKGVAECTLIQPGPPLPLVPLKVELLDSYAPGGLPGRMLQRIVIDGREAVAHDPAAEPGTGWVAAPVGTGSPRKVTVEVEALSPDSSVPWGAAAGARLRVSALRGGS